MIDPVTTTSKKASEIYDAHVDSLYEEDNFQKSIILKRWEEMKYREALYVLSFLK